MKKFFSLVSLACAVMLLPSCTSDLDVDVAEAESPSNASGSDMVEVSLNMGGDFLSMTETPITRAGASKKTWYAVNVLYLENPNDTSVLIDLKSKNFRNDFKSKDGKTTYLLKDTIGNYKNYAYGLFDDPSQMTIKLSNQFTYKFECTIVQEDYNEIYYGTNDKGETFYSYPFIDCATFLNSNNNVYYQKKLDATLTKNKFIYSSNFQEQETNQVNLSAIKGGLAYVKLNPDAVTLKETPTTSVDDKNNTVGHFVGNLKETYMSGLTFVEEKKPSTSIVMHSYAKVKYPGVDRWYGELDDYKTSDGPILNIDMKRTGFGLRFVVTPPADGKLYIWAEDMMFAQVTPTTGVKIIESMFSFEKVYECWLALQKSVDEYGYEKAEDRVKNFTKARADYLENYFKIYFTRVRADGSKQTYQMRLNAKRNNIYTINVDAERMINSGFALTSSDDLPTYETINGYE